MPLGKYYCDYCEKQFQDTPFARKRHLQSLSHQKAKALWFDSFRGPPSLCFLLFPSFPLPRSFFLFIADPNQAFSDGFGRGVCNRFVRTVFLFAFVLKPNFLFYFLAHSAIIYFVRFDFEGVLPIR